MQSAAGMRRLPNSAAFWGETWSLAMQALRAHKLRALLAMLGVVIGTGCVVLVVTAALAGRQYILAQIEGVGANLVYANLVTSEQPGSVALTDHINTSDMDAVRQGVPQLLAQVAGTNSTSMTMDVDGTEHDVNMVGVTPGFSEIRNLEVLAGRYFAEDDFASRNKVCLITEALARRVFSTSEPAGREIRIGELHLRVIGVFRERVATLGQSEITRESIIVPFSLFRYYTGIDYLQTLYAQARHSDEVPMVTQEVSQILQERHRVGAQYRVQNLAGILATARRIAEALTLVLVVVALIALTISGIGIMNIMLVTVTERTREIGIRRAIGASRDAILYQFLLEALAISGTGALVGIVIAVSVPALLNFLMGFFPEVGEITIPVSWVSVVLAFVVSCATGLIFGYLPASRAAKLQPTESLRYE